MFCQGFDETQDQTGTSSVQVPDNCVNLWVSLYIKSDLKDNWNIFAPKYLEGEGTTIRGR